MNGHVNKDLLICKMQFKDLKINGFEFISDKLIEFISLRDKMAAIGNLLSNREVSL